MSDFRQRAGVAPHVTNLNRWIKHVRPPPFEFGPDRLFLQIQIIHSSLNLSVFSIRNLNTFNPTKRRYSLSTHQFFVLFLFCTLSLSVNHFSQLKFIYSSTFFKFSNPHYTFSYK